MNRTEAPLFTPLSMQDAPLGSRTRWSKPIDTSASFPIYWQRWLIRLQR